MEVNNLKKKVITILIIILVIEIIGAVLLTATSFFDKPTTKSTNSEVPTIATTNSTENITTLASQSKESSPISIPIDKWVSSETEISFPILMYHSLSEGNSLKIPTTEFKQHMEWLKQEGYYSLTPEEAYQVLSLNKQPSEKIVWITFDDGYLNNYTDGYPILKELNLKATINYITSKEGADSVFNLDQMKEMKDSGIVSIQSHTVNHLEVNDMPSDQQTSEMVDSKKYLDMALSQDTIELCYPAGRYNEDNFLTAEQAGYKMALTTEPGYARKSDGLFALKRVRVSPGYDGPSFGNLITSFQ